MSEFRQTLIKINMDSSYMFIIRIFQLICFILAVYMSYLQFSRYVANGDVSIISFRTFNFEKQDTYPSYSMCLKGLDGEIFKENEIKAIWNNVENSEGFSMYQDAIRGGGNFSKEVIEMDFDNVTVNFLEDIFVSLQTYTKDGKIYDVGTLYSSYQDSNYICTTRDVPFEKDVLINKDQVMLDPEKVVNEKLSLMIFLHQMGGLTKSLLSGQEPLIELKYQDFLELFGMFESLYESKSFYTADVRVDQVEVLRKRGDSVVPCHEEEENHNEDFEWMLRVMTDVGCVPTFWKKIYSQKIDQEDKIELADCTDALQYLKIDNYTSRYNIMKKINPNLKPCKQSSIFANLDIYYVSNEAKHELLLRVSHINEEYKQTLNVRSFDEETLLSTVGGYIGIFLGYSLLQLPSILLDTFPRSCCCKNFKQLYQ